MKLVTLELLELISRGIGQFDKISTQRAASLALDEIARLTADNKRLREALTRLLDAELEYDDSVAAADNLDTAVAQARTALAQEDFPE